MSEIVIEVKQLGRCSDMWNGSTIVEFAIGDELDPCGGSGFLDSGIS